MQSNPSILTTGLSPKLPPTDPIFFSDVEEDSGDIPVRTLLSLNRVSCVNGLDTLLGGDPLKNGEEEATGVLSKMISISSRLAIDSYCSG